MSPFLNNLSWFSKRYCLSLPGSPRVYPPRQIPQRCLAGGGSRAEPPSTAASMGLGRTGRGQGGCPSWVGGLRSPTLLPTLGAGTSWEGRWGNQRRGCPGTGRRLCPGPVGLERGERAGLSPADARTWNAGTLLDAQWGPGVEEKARQGTVVPAATGRRCWPCPAALPWPVLPSTALNPLALHN